MEIFCMNCDQEIAWYFVVGIHYREVDITSIVWMTSSSSCDMKLVIWLYTLVRAIQLSRWINNKSRFKQLVCLSWGIWLLVFHPLHWTYWTVCSYWILQRESLLRSRYNMTSLRMLIQQRLHLPGMNKALRKILSQSYPNCSVYSLFSFSRYS